MIPLVLLHGFTGAPSSWDALAAHLPAHRPTVRETLCGHGDPALDGAADFDGEVDRIASRLRRGGIDRADLCGYSLGARVALGLLVRHPALVRTAVVVGGSPGLQTAEERAERARLEAGWVSLLRQGIEPFVQMWERFPLFATQRDTAALERQRLTRLAHRPSGLIRSLEVLGLAAMPDLRPALRGLPHEVVLVAGALDDKFVRSAREMAALLPNGRVRVLDGVGHNVPLEAPESLARILLDTPASGQRSNEDRRS